MSRFWDYLFFGSFPKTKLISVGVFQFCLPNTPPMVFISKQLFGGYVFGFELIILNGALVFVGLFLIEKIKYILHFVKFVSYIVVLFVF